MDARDEWEGVAAETALHSPTDPARAHFHLTPPPPEHGIPADFLGSIRGRSVTVASFRDGSQHPTFHRRLRAWSELYRTAPEGRDPYAWRVDVVTEAEWWMHALLGSEPRVVSFPAAFVWIEEEGAGATPRPLP